MHRTQTAPTIRARRVTALLATGALTLVACGGSDDDTGEDDTATTVAPIADEPEPEPQPAPEPEPEPQPEPEPEPLPAPEPEPVVFDLSEVPALVGEVGDALADASIAPLGVAQRTVGFPLEIPTPEGTTLIDLSASVRAVAGEEGDQLVHAFQYSVAGAVADVDITLDGNGPGSAELIEIYDPILSGVGYERANSTGSDPGDPGGPNSVNHVYLSSEPSVDVNGVPAIPISVFVWADEAVVGSDDSDAVPGRRIDAEFEVAVQDGLAVPLLSSLADAVPAPDGATVSRGDVRLIPRSEGAFDIDKGPFSLQTSVEWAVPGATYDDLVAFYADPAVLAVGGGPVMGAEASFFNDGEWEPTEGDQIGEGQWRQFVLLLERYDGSLEVRAPQEAGGPATVSLSFDLDPVAPALAPPVG